MELIKDRLAHILRAKNLTATQFAELMQIQPSNVSHLLSGRNNPSLDFLKKLKEVFPEYSFDWIILGKKPITVNEPFTFPKEQDTLPAEEIQFIDNPDFTPFDDMETAENKSFNEPSTSNQRDFSETSKGLKQIIYVFEDHTFEIYNIRK